MLLGNLEASHTTLLETSRRPDRIADRNAVPALLEALGTVALQTRRAPLFKRLLIDRLRAFHTNVDERRAVVGLMLRSHRGLRRLLGSRELSIADKLLWLTCWTCLGAARHAGWRPIARLFEACVAGSAYVRQYGPRSLAARRRAMAPRPIEATLVTRAMGGVGDSSAFLHELVRAASFVSFDDVDGAVRPHVFNRPMPERLSDLFADPADGIAGMVLKFVPHVQLLTVGLPFCSLCLVLKKPAPAASVGVMPFAGLEDSRRFIEEGVRLWRARVESSQLSLDPFGLFGELCPARGSPRLLARDRESTLFHTGYVWLGGVARAITVNLEAWPSHAGQAVIELRVHRKPTRGSDEVICSGSTTVVVRRRERVRVSLQLAAHEDCSYAVLGKVISGACWIDDPAVQISPGGCPETCSTES